MIFSWIDILGYIGMAFVLASFLMKDVKWIRIVNMVGGTLSCAYGIITHTIPTACLNAALIVINLVYLILIFRKEKKNQKNNQEICD